jgi:hypothetical protein
VIGTAGLGLIGGFELAAGVVIGAGVAALIRTANDRAPVAKPHEAGDDARTVTQRLSPEVTKRVRAVVQAARGKLAPAAK